MYYYTTYILVWLLCRYYVHNNTTYYYYYYLMCIQRRYLSSYRIAFCGTIDYNIRANKKGVISPTGSRHGIAIESERNVLYALVLAGAIRLGFIKYCIILLYYVILLSRTITIQNGALVSCVCANPQRLQ